METILLAEDEVVLGRLIKEALERKSYKVIWAPDGRQAYDLYCQHQPDLCILDVMMPAINGFALAAMIRSLSGAVPVLFLTARSETEDVIKGFESGGNDYLKKPFSLEELLLRVRELLRRGAATTVTGNITTTDIYRIGTYTFNPVTQILKSPKQDYTLSFKECQLLLKLLEYKNTLTPRKEVLIALWGDDNFFHSRTMDVYVVRLRKYFKDDPDLSIINIRGFGFKLIDDAQ